MSAYTLCKKIILAKTYTKEVITTRVEVFYNGGQLNEEEYTELIGLINEKYAA